MQVLFRWVAVVVLVLGPALGASAHAALVETEPADGARLEEPPGRIAIRFNEPVDLPMGALRVFDVSGRRVDFGDVSTTGSGEAIEITVGDLPEGTYVVAWRAVSLDGHPVRGAFVFGVGDADAVVDESVVDELLGDAGAAARIAGVVIRAVTYLAGLMGAGAAFFSAFVLDVHVVRLALVVRRAALVCAAASLLMIPAFVLEAGATWGEAATSSVGSAVAVRIGAMAVVYLSARQAAPAAAWAVAGLMLLVAAELATGHTRTSDPLAVVLAADAVHVLGAAFWLGGVVGLRVAWNQMAGDTGGMAAVVRRFSGLAVIFVLGLVAAGLALAWVEVGSWSALVTTAYGWTLVAKLVVAAVVLGLAVYNNRVLVPRLAGFGTSGPSAWERLRSTVRAELVGLVVVVAITAVLVDLQPAAEAAGVTGPYSTYLDFGEGQLNLVVDPNRVGTNQIHAYVLTAAGAPSAAEGEGVLEFHFPAEDIGPIVRPAVFAGPGHWLHTGPELAVAGEWHITFRVGEGFESTTATAVVAVGG